MSEAEVDFYLRAFGYDPEETAQRLRAFIDGLMAFGVAQGNA